MWKSVRSFAFSPTKIYLKSSKKSISHMQMKNYQKQISRFKVDIKENYLINLNITLNLKS